MQNKESISFDEFRAWLTGLIQGKRGALPDMEDWKEIKKNLDKVEPEVITLPVPSTPSIPEQPPINEPWRYPSQPWTSPNTGPYIGDPINPYTTWCSSTGDLGELGELNVSGYSVNVGTCTDPNKVETPTFDPESFQAAFEQLFAGQNYSIEESVQMHLDLQEFNNGRDEEKSNS